MKQKYIHIARLGLFVIIALTYTAFRFNILIHTPPASKFDDSGSYLRAAEVSLFSLDFWTVNRPPFVPLIYKILGNDLLKISIFQIIFSSLCWGILAVVASRIFKTRIIQLISFTIILLFGLSADILRWDTIVMSESISISLFALWIANWIWLIERWQWRKVISLIATTGCFILGRETNAWIVLMIAGLLLCIGIIWRSQRKVLLISIVFFLLFIVNSVCSDQGKRWVMPFLNVLGTRILPSPEYLSYFEKKGMPVNDTLMQYENHWSTALRTQINKNPELQDFKLWLMSSGKRAYITFLLSHPEPLLQDPLRNFVNMMSAEVSTYEPKGFTPVLNKPLAEIIFPERWVWALVWIFPFIMGLLIPMAISKKLAKLIIPLMMLILVYPQAVIAYHGDSMGLTRHPLLTAIQLRLGIWLTLLFVLDWIVIEVIQRSHEVKAFLANNRNMARLLTCIGLVSLLLTTAVYLISGKEKIAIYWSQWVGAGAGILFLIIGCAMFIRNSKGQGFIIHVEI